MTDTNQKPKKSTKKWIYIGAGLAVFTLIGAGVGFWIWHSKSSTQSEAADEAEEDINPEEIPPKIKEHRKKNWIDPETGLCNYYIPEKELLPNISVSQAKDEVIEAIHQWWKSLDKKKVAIILEKNAKVINLADKKGNEDDPLFETKFTESMVKKYQPKKIFSNLPTQNNFKKSLAEIRENLYLLRQSFELKYKGNKKIDWIASLREYTKETKNRTKTQQEEDFAKMTNYLERDFKPFIAIHLNQFPSLNNLKELNHWTHTLVKKEKAASMIILSRFLLGRNLKKAVISPARGGIERKKIASQKNEKFGLEPIVMTFKL